MEKREYRSAVRSRRLIREAFLQMLREKELERITVTDIVRRADINRSTFYAHYQDLRAVLEEIQNEATQRTLALVKELRYDTIFRQPELFMQTLCGPLLAENRELYRLLGSSEYARRQIEVMKADFAQSVLTSPDLPASLRGSKPFRIRISFFIAGVFDVYLQWLQGSLDCPVEVVSQEVAALIRATVQAYPTDDGLLAAFQATLPQ